MASVTSEDKLQRELKFAYAAIVLSLLCTVASGFFIAADTYNIVMCLHICAHINLTGVVLTLLKVTAKQKKAY